MTTTTWDEVSARRGRNELPGLLAEHFWDLGAADRRAGVIDAWTGAESPESSLPQKQWLEFFAQTGFLEERELGTRPVESLTLFRGCDYATRRRMSWTEDLGLAIWFAARSNRAGERATGTGWGAVMVATVKPNSLLAHVTAERSGEDEFVINPKGVRMTILLRPTELPTFTEARERLAERSEAWR